MDKTIESTIEDFREFRETLTSDVEKLTLDIGVIRYLMGKMNNKQEYRLCMIIYCQKGADYLISK